MMRRILMGIAMLALLAPLASAQTVDELIAKNVEAKGGLKKLKAVETTRTTGKMILTQGLEIPLVMVQKRPRSFRMDFSLQGMANVQAYDGKTAWISMPIMGKKEPEPMGAEEAKVIEQRADFDGPLVDYKEKGNTIELVGKEQVEGADAYKLKVTLKSGDVRYIYLDAETYLEIKAEMKEMLHGTALETESFMGDYKEVDGLMMPFAIETGPKGSPDRRKIVIEKVELNPVVPDSLFGMPASAATDSTKAGTTAAAPDSSQGATSGAKSATPAKSEAKKPAAAVKKPEAAGKK
jgi:outer membrane lipoprotein-sorting protein